MLHNPRELDGGGKIILWGCFSSRCRGGHHCIEELMDRAIYRKILDKNLPSARTLKMGCRDGLSSMTMTPKILSRQQRKLKKHIKVMEWPSQSKDLSPKENMWRKLILQCAMQQPRNLQDLESFKEKLAKMCVPIWWLTTRNILPLCWPTKDSPSHIKSCFACGSNTYFKSSSL